MENFDILVKLDELLFLAENNIKVEEDDNEN